MLIVHITDFHVAAEGRLVYGLVDSRERLERAVEAIGRLDPAPDAVLVTGDLVDAPDREAYRFVAAALGRIEVPVLVVPGNHDARSVLLESFPDLPTIGAERFVAYAVDRFPVRLIGLDTSREGTHLAEFCGERARWLDVALSTEPTRPTLLFLHHPPIETGVEAMDFLGLDWARELEAVVRRHPQIVRIACGHHHRAMSAAWAGTLVTVAPSVSHQFPSRFGDDALPAVALETPGMLLHWWTGRGLVSHAVPIDPAPTREFFTGRRDLWLQAIEALRAGKPIPNIEAI